MQDLLFEILQSVLVVIVGYIFGKIGKRTKTLEQIEAKEEARKQKRIAKQCKKNYITPVNSQAVVQELPQLNQDVVLEKISNL